MRRLDLLAQTSIPEPPHKRPEAGIPKETSLVIERIGGFKSETEEPVAYWQASRRAMNHGAGLPQAARSHISARTQVPPAAGSIPGKG